MSDISRVEIQISKSKLAFLFLGSIGFVVAGLFFVISPKTFLTTFIRSTSIIFVAGLASVLFFSFTGFYISKKLFDKKPGLIISSEGITDNSGGLSIGFIPWHDITEVSETIVANQKFICLSLKNFELYLNKQPNRMKRWLMKMNYKHFDTGVGISSNGLDCKYEALKQLIHERFIAYKSANRV